MKQNPPTMRRVVIEIEDSYDLSDEQLADKVGVHRTTISRLRTGSALSTSYALGDRLIRLWEARPK